MARPATRNLGRLSEIAQVLVRHGFGYVFERHRLTDLLPWRERAAPLDGQPSQRGRALREALDELGPTFVKFGQLLSMRPDVLPPDIISELRLLQADARPFGFDEVQRVIDEELGLSAARQIEADLALLYQLARLLRERVRALDFVDTRALVDEFARGIRAELDYRL